MKKLLITLILTCFALPGGFTLGNSTSTPQIILTPSRVIQGEPVKVTFENTKISNIKSLTYDGKKIGVLLYQNIPTALIGVDLYKKPGDYKIIAKLSNGQNLQAILSVSARKKIETAMAVPDQLGGNSPANQTKVVAQLVNENTILADFYTGTKAFWTAKFNWPILNVNVTDDYGYTRITGDYDIAHKGVDLQAEMGTKVRAMNRGVVRIAEQFPTYGKTIVVDHGLGLSTFYMHLSKIYVEPGQLVLPGQLIGLSGNTGYSTAPHLHITVRINQVSIDPVKFMKLFTRL
ncbi:MAG: M23 family metallopeptidase [bacterium]